MCRRSMRRSGRWPGSPTGRFPVLSGLWSPPMSAPPGTHDDAADHGDPHGRRSAGVSVADPASVPNVPCSPACWGPRRDVSAASRARSSTTPRRTPKSSVTKRSGRPHRRSSASSRWVRPARPILTSRGRSRLRVSAHLLVSDGQQPLRRGRRVTIRSRQNLLWCRDFTVTHVSGRPCPAQG